MTRTNRYSSCFRHGVDEKRRLAVPSKWRPSEAEVEFTLIVWPKGKDGSCLRVLPPEQMEKLLQTVNEMPNSDPSKTVLKRFIGSKSVQVTLDKAGRFCLPEEMAREAGITDQVVLVGLLDRFEIWSPERYKSVEVSDSVMTQKALEMME
jgi:MraZ protein